MIHITKGQVNTVIVTVTENATLTSPVYLFEFICDQTGLTKVFTQDNTSTGTTRYDEFLIEETSSEDLYNGKVELVTPGSYTYNIYEIEVSSPQDLDIANAVSKVETGKLIVHEATVTPTPAFDIDETTNYAVFDPENINYNN